MYCKISKIHKLFLLLLVPVLFFALNCNNNSSGRAAEPQFPPAKRALNNYVPGLGEIMSVIQMRHLKLWFAGHYRNWPLASYELTELKEGFADAMRYHPTHKQVPQPLTTYIPEFMDNAMHNLQTVITRQDSAAFPAAFDAVTAGCNNCHIASKFAFNVVIRPEENPYPNQRFKPLP